MENLFGNLMDKAKEAAAAAADVLGDAKDAALEKVEDLKEMAAENETLQGLKEKAGDFYEKAQTAATEAAAEAKEEAGEALETGKGFWEKAKTFAAEKTEEVKSHLS